MDSVRTLNLKQLGVGFPFGWVTLPAVEQAEYTETYMFVKSVESNVYNITMRWVSTVGLVTRLQLKYYE